VIGVGTVIGSNIANLSVVLGAALVAPIAVRADVVRREAPPALLASVAFAEALQTGLTRVTGLVLLLLLAGPSPCWCGGRWRPAPRRTGHTSWPRTSTSYCPQTPTGACPG
jgi:hypothetical protein